MAVSFRRLLLLSNPLSQWLRTSFPLVWRIRIFYPLFLASLVVLGFYWYELPVTRLSDVPYWVYLEKQLNARQFSWLIGLGVLSCIWVFQVFKYPLLDGRASRNMITWVVALLLALILFGSPFAHVHNRLMNMSALYDESAVVEDKRVLAAMCSSKLQLAETEYQGFFERWQQYRGAKPELNFQTLYSGQKGEGLLFEGGSDQLPLDAISRELAGRGKKGSAEQGQWGEREAAVLFQFCAKYNPQVVAKLKRAEPDTVLRFEYLGEGVAGWHFSAGVSEKIETLEHAYHYRQLVLKGGLLAFLVYHPLLGVYFLASLSLSILVVVISNRGFGSFAVCQEFIAYRYSQFRKKLNLTRLEYYFSQRMPRMWAMGNHNLIPDLILGAVAGFLIPLLMLFLTEDEDVKMMGVFFGAFMAMLLYSAYRCVRLRRYHVPMATYPEAFVQVLSALVFQLPFYVSLILVSQLGWWLHEDVSSELTGLDGAAIFSAIVGWAVLWSVVVMFVSSFSRDVISLILVVIIQPLIIAMLIGVEVEPGDTASYGLFLLILCMLSGFLPVCNRFHKWIALIFLAQLNLMISFALFGDDNTYSLTNMVESILPEVMGELESRWGYEHYQALFFALNPLVTIVIWLPVAAGMLRRIYVFESRPI